MTDVFIYITHAPSHCCKTLELSMLTEDTLVLKQTSPFRNKLFALVYKVAAQSRRKKA